MNGLDEAGIMNDGDLFISFFYSQDKHYLIEALDFAGELQEEIWPEIKPQ